MKFENTKRQTFVVPNVLSNSDLGQSIVRLVIGSVALLLMIFSEGAIDPSKFTSEESQLFFYVLLIYLIFSTVLTYFSVTRYSIERQIHNYRRISSVFLDLGIAGLGLHLTNEYSLIMFSVFLTIIIGYGFRFGVKYLIYGVIVGLAVIVTLGLFSPFYFNNIYLTIGMGVGILIVPTYAAFLLAKYQKVLFQLDESNRARARFIANMSHELRTPLHAILLNTESLMEKFAAGDSNPVVMRPLRVISESSSYLKRLVDRVLDISSNEAGAFTLGEPARLDFFSVISEATNIASAEARHKNVNVQLSVSPRTPRFFIGWQQQLQEVLVNIIGNAAKFTRKGKISIRVEAVADEGNSQSGSVFIEVVDTGEGISSDRLPQIFEPFITGDDSRSRRNEGTGIGLTLTRQYIEAMNGTITVESVLSKGTSVKISIPYRLTNDTDSSDARLDFIVLSDSARASSNVRNPRTLRVSEYFSAANAAWKVDCIMVEETVANEFLVRFRDQEPKQRIPTVLVLNNDQKKSIDESFLYGIPDLSERSLGAVSALCASTNKTISVAEPKRPKQVLIIDDNLNNRKSSQMVLENAGHVVHTANSGENGLSLIAENIYDLIFLDMHMPELSGVQTIEKAKDLATRELPPIVMLTADATLDAYEDAKISGVKAFLTKPISASALRDAVEQYSLGNDNAGVMHPNEQYSNDIDRARQELEDLVANGTPANKILEMLDSYARDFNSTIIRCSVTAAGGDHSALRKLLHKLQGSAAAMHLGSIVKSMKDAEQIETELLCENFLANAEVYHNENTLLVSKLKSHLRNEI